MKSYSKTQLISRTLLKSAFVRRTEALWIALCLATAGASLGAPGNEASLDLKQSKRTSFSPQAIIALGTTQPDSGGSAELESILDATKGKTQSAISEEKGNTKLRLDAVAQEINALATFVQQHPDSPWTPSVRSSLGKHFRDRGRYSDALEQWRAAWLATRDFKDGDGKKVADDALVHLTRLLANLGKQEDLQAIFEEIDQRNLDSGPLQQMMMRTKEAFVQMSKRPEVAFTCGTLALDQVIRRLNNPNYNSRLVRDARAPKNGFSLIELKELAKQQGLNFVCAERLDGGDIIIPSIIHWRPNHYGAVVDRSGELYEVYNFIDDHPVWMELDAINAESSGNFLIPSDKMPAKAWRQLTLNEAGRIVGRSNPYLILNDALDRGCENPSGCAGCGLAPLSGVGGMPEWRVSEPYINLWLHDEPLAYQPAVGGRISLHLAYKQRDENSNLDNGIWSFGNGVNCEWLSYAETQNPETFVEVFLPGGGKASFVLVNDTGQDYHNNFRLTATRDGAGVIRSYELQRPDGSREVYDFLRYTTAGTWSQAFRSKSFDPQGHITRFDYAAYNPNSMTVRLDLVTDPDGLFCQIAYLAGIANYPNLVSGVNDPFGRAATFTYNASANLTGITDVGGLSSSISYQSSTGWPISLSTPYGITTFASVDKATSPDSNGDRSITITTPNGSRQTYAFLQSLDFMPSAYPPGDVPSGAPLSNWENAPNVRDSFYWNGKQREGLPDSIDNFTPVHFQKARMKHWGPLPASTGNLAEVVWIEREPSPESDGSIEGQKTWYAYEGSQILPAQVARRLPDTSTSYVYQQRNNFGNPLTMTSTYGTGMTPSVRTFNYNYAPNGIDLLEESGPNGLIARYTYEDPFHQIKTITRPVTGEADYVTTFSYRAGTRQIETVSEPGGVVTAYSYFSNNRLREIWVQPINRINSFTYYSNGLVQNYTDERGIVETYTWDNLQRIVRIDFSSGGYIENHYSLDHELRPGGGFNILDLTSTRNRTGHWTYFDYNGMRQVVTKTENTTPQQITSFRYCSCGALETITNAKGEVTRSIYDNAGHLRTTVFSDGTVDARSINYEYDLLGRLSKVKDHFGTVVRQIGYNNQGLASSVNTTGTGASFGQIANISYDVFDRPNTIAYTTGPSITLSYDQLDRLRTRSTSGAGTETWTYSPLGPLTFVEQLDSSNTRTTRYDYNLTTRTTTVTNGRGFQSRFSYNSAGDLTSLVDENNQTTSWQYDYINRVTRKFLGATEVAESQYNNNNQVLLRSTREKGNTYFTYDTIGNLRFIDYLLKADVALDYDSLNRLIRVSDASFGTVNFDYTPYGTLWYEDTAAWANSRVTYSYNMNRLRDGLRLAQPTGVDWTQNYGYDSAGRLRTLTGSAGAFTYNYLSPSAWVHSINLPNNSSINNTPDGVGRLQETALKNSSLVNLNRHFYTHDFAHQRRQQTRSGLRGDGQYFENLVDYGYDSDGELQSAAGRELSGATRHHEQINYTYDPAGNLTQRQSNNGMGTGWARGFSYGNGFNRLSSSSYSGTLTVAGMTDGGATAVTVNNSGGDVYTDGSFAVRGQGVTASYTATASNAGGGRTDAISVNPASSISYTYDNNGNLRGDGQRLFSYDDENQLVRVEVQGSWAVDFVYDGLGRRRIRREYSGSQMVSETHYIYDGMTVIQERNQFEQVVATYTRGRDLSGSLQGSGGIGGLLARTDSSGTAYYHSDGGGNITALINASQQIVARYLYDPFGNLIGLSGPLADANKYRFSSKEFDDRAGLYYYGFRFYEPSLQRWLNQDRLGEIFEINLYQFNKNSPLSYTDSDGLWPTGAYGSQNVHGNSINRVLAFLPEEDRKILIQQQIRADQDQTANGAYKHAMRNATTSETVEQACSRANAFVRKLILEGRNFEAQGQHVKAMGNLGLVIHALGDSTSPKHYGFKPWDGNETSLGALSHGIGENFDPGPGSRLDTATKAAWEYFTGKKPLPVNVFTFGHDSKP